MKSLTNLLISHTQVWRVHVQNINITDHPRHQYGMMMVLTQINDFGIQRCSHLVIPTTYQHMDDITGDTGWIGSLLPLLILYVSTRLIQHLNPKWMSRYACITWLIFLIPRLVRIIFWHILKHVASKDLRWNNNKQKRKKEKIEKKEQQTSPYLVTATESTCVLVPKITQYLASPLICVDYWVSVSQ